jgi:outer membrane protein TolC
LKRLVLITLLIGAGTTLPAAESAAAANAVVQRLTLDDAIARARANSPRLESFRALTRAASENVRGAQAGKRPDLDIQAAYSRNSNVPELILSSPGAPPRVIFPNLPSQWRTHVGASLPLYTGGRVQNQVGAAREAEGASIADRAAAENDLVAETHIAYVNVLFARETARVLREAIASYEAHLKDSRARQDVGLAASHEVLAVTVERERAELGRVLADNASAMAAANLLRLVGLPPDTEVEVELDPAPLGLVASPVALEDQVKRASAGRPELDALRARIRSLEATSRVAQSSSRPQAGLQAGFDYSNPNPRILPLAGEWKDSWSVGLNVSWKILDGGRSSASAAQSQAQADALRAQLRDLESRIRLDVTTRRLELESALAGKAVALRGIEAAKDAVRVAKDRYREGVLSSSELLDAETRLLRAELEATQTEAQIQIALANLTRAVGR